MFWKKKKQTINYTDPMYQEEQREFFRYIFKGDQRLPMSFQQKSVEIFDLSAGGMAFGDKGFKQYDVDQITLVLDIPNFRGNTKFSAQLRILDITASGICHCIFENCTVTEYETIHKYVLEMQKNDLINKP